MRNDQTFDIEKIIKKKPKKALPEPQDILFEFKDNNGDRIKCKVRIIETIGIDIRAFNEENMEVGYIHLWQNQETPSKWFLSEVYAYSSVRGRGIAGRLSEIADFCLRKHDGSLIIGDFTPTQMSTDRQNEVYASKEELEERAKKFYASAGYDIVRHEEFKAYPKNYPDLGIYDFEKDYVSDAIVVKKIKQKDYYPFVFVDGVYVHESANESINQK